MAYGPMKNESRTMEQLTAHYDIERELAGRLRNASKPERRQLYSTLYDELYRRVPLHPQLTRKSSPQERMQAVRSQMKFLAPFLRDNVTFLEIGPGDCALSVEANRYVKQVYAVDVSDEITKVGALATRPPNFHLVLSDGSSIPVPPGSVDVAYSNQLMEHLHPDDAAEQLKNIYDALAPGGVYICITPNRLNGPHDISRLFDKVATGFHLKEYTTLELSRLFRKVGFSRVRAYIGARGKYIGLPAFPIVANETLLDGLPHALRKAIAGIQPFRSLLGVRLVGMK